MKKTIFSLLLVLCLVFVGTISALAVVQGELGTLNVLWSDSLNLTTPGKTTYTIDAETYVMSITVSSKLNGQTLYVEALDGVDLMLNSVTQQSVDGWYSLSVKNLKFALVNWNQEAVTLTIQTTPPACAHSEESIIGYAATCTTAGLTDGKKCTICGEITIRQEAIPAYGHSYTNGYCATCGEADPDYVALPDIDASRMILGNALEFQFGIDMAKIPNTTGYYAVIEKTWADGANTFKVISSEDWGTVGPYWAIVYDGLAAKEMSDIFYVTIYNADGIAVSTTKTDSVRDYVMRNVNSQTAILKTLMVNMLNYGADAQVNFNYGTNDLANNQLTDTQKAWATAEVAALNNNLESGAYYMGTRLVLESRIQLQVAFKGLTRDMYAIYTFTDNDGKEQNVRVEGADFVDVGILGVEMSKLVYADARSLVEITVYNADDTVYGTATDSIEGYAARNSSNVVVMALMKFADSARKYLYNK